MGWMDEAMETLRPWIGRVRTVEDDIGMMAVRRVAATFDVDPDSIKRGQELPPHWDIPQWQASPDEAATSPMTTRPNIRAQKRAIVLKSGCLISLSQVYYTN